MHTTSSYSLVISVYFSQSTGSKKQENIGESIKELLIQMVIFDLKRGRMAKC